MEEAIHELESVPSSSIRSFAKQYGFDESTLRFRLKRRDANLALEIPDRKYVFKYHLLFHHLNIAIASCKFVQNSLTR